MFGPPKQFGNANPFGAQQQSTFGKPPTNAFGQTSTFGQQSTSLFGSTQPAAGVFGATQTPAFGATQTPSFGAPTATTQSGFGKYLIISWIIFEVISVYEHDAYLNCYNYNVLKQTLV